MIYINKNTGEVLTSGKSGELNKLFPNTSIPQRDLSVDELSSLGLIAVSDKPNDTLTHTSRLGVTVSNGSATAQWVWEPLEDDVIALRRADVNALKIAEAKAEASRRILTRLPDWKQRNYLAHSLELTRKGEDNLTPEETASIAFMEAEWEYAKSIREASNLIEAHIATLTDEEAGAYDVSASELWP